MLPVLLLYSRLLFKPLLFNIFVLLFVVLLFVTADVVFPKLLVALVEAPLVLLEVVPGPLLGEVRAPTTPVLAPVAVRRGPVRSHGLGGDFCVGAVAMSRNASKTLQTISGGLHQRIKRSPFERVHLRRLLRSS